MALGSDRPGALLSRVAPQAGLIGLGRLPEHVDSNAFAARLLLEPYRTFVLPGSACHYLHHIRLGVGGGVDVKLDVWSRSVMVH